MIYGYGRVSTKGQAKDGNSLEAQERLLKEHGAEVIYMDSFTGTKITRSEFVERFPELSLFYRLFSPLNSEMICIFPYFCPYAESAREIREIFS